VLATVSTPTGRCSTSIKRYAHFLLPVAPCSFVFHRVVPSHSAHIVELYASLGPPMSAATVAVRKHILRELVHKMAILRVSFSRDT
jgi:hypothetical protein